MLENSTALLDTPDAPATALDFVDTARLEFQASLRLLAERACFLTAADGCAIALKKDDTLTFCVVIGNSHREPGSEASLDVEGLRECVETCQFDASSGEPKFTLFVPIVADDQTVGAMELLSSYECPGEIHESLLRIAGLVNVAWNLRQAAENASEQILRDTQNLRAPAPLLWHAPEKSDRASIPADHVPANNVAHGVRTCTSCGFPVSPGRTLCVACDQKPGAYLAPSNALFASDKPESWLSAHGYTIATVLVSLVTIALVVWLRR